jgi:hypothetical protein
MRMHMALEEHSASRLLHLYGFDIRYCRQYCVLAKEVVDSHCRNNGPHEAACARALLASNAGCIHQTRTEERSFSKSAQLHYRKRLALRT